MKHKYRIGVRRVALLFTVFGVIMGLLVAPYLSKGAPVQDSAALVVMQPSLAGAKAVDYINANLLQGQGVVAELKNVTEASGIYSVRVDLKKGGSVVQSAEVYATRDGKSLLLGNIIDLTVSSEKPAATEAVKKDPPDVKMFVMSFCPYGKQAENGLGSAARLVGVDVEPHFVIYENYRGGGPDFCIESGKYCSMHGIAELEEDLRQLCVYKSFRDKWWAYVDYVNSKCSLQSIGSCWKDAAAAAGIDASVVESCQRTEGASLAKAERELNVKHGVEGSPTVMINGAQYQGGRSSEDFKEALCAAFENPPSSCGEKLNSSAGTTTASCG